MGGPSSLLFLTVLGTSPGPSLLYKPNSEYLVSNPVQAALQSNKRLKAKHFFLIFLAWHDPEELNLH
jgi:hypothetical protein